ncbi:MAG: hypothetical protein ABIS50_11580 [Luteolibacter sp.]|uniref:hypothetical protein n=1 Tax=Luteolibacter sp. TaxID=1962973 RepID=UPI0032665C24
MPAAFGTLIERLYGQTVFFAPNGSLIGTSGAAISATAKPATPSTAYPDYSLGRVSEGAYDPKSQTVVRSWCSPTGGKKQRTDTKAIEDAFNISTIDFPPQLYDQIMFGTDALAAAGSQQIWKNGARYKDGWFYSKLINESGVAFGVMEFHARLTITKFPKINGEAAVAEWRVTDLADGGALNTIDSAVG